MEDENTPPTAPDPQQGPRHTSLLRRGNAQLKPPKAPPKPKRVVINDAAHPVRGGKQRQRAFAKRPARRKGSIEWSTRQLDEGGFQERTLRKAFRLFENKQTRLAICKQTRATRVPHKHLPLKPRTSKPCTNERCNCKPWYRILVGKDGGMGDGTPTFVRSAPPSPPPPACTHAC